MCSSEICFPFCGMILKSYSCAAYFFSDPPICSAVLLIITFFTFSLIRFKDSAVMILIFSPILLTLTCKPDSRAYSQLLLFPLLLFLKSTLRCAFSYLFSLPQSLRLFPKSYIYCLHQTCLVKCGFL